ncbi:MAG: hypothetical protein GX102_08735 [Porphyromonadaceae bacterium]|nr:hypothetical protein [Porphyromonadaceae bacterium]
MRNLKFIPLFFLSFVFIFSCNGKKSDSSRHGSDAIVNVVFTVDSLLASADQLVNKIITVEGECSHLCTRSGKKLFLEGSSDSLVIRAESEKAFRQECINKKVRVTGKMIEKRIDEAYLAEWESEIKSDSHEDCNAEKRSVGQKEIDSDNERIADFRARIAAEKEKNGKDYLAFYHIETTNYRVVE